MHDDDSGGGRSTRVQTLSDCDCRLLIILLRDSEILCLNKHLRLFSDRYSSMKSPFASSQLSLRAKAQKRQEYIYFGVSQREDFIIVRPEENEVAQR